MSKIREEGPKERENARISQGQENVGVVGIKEGQ